MGILQALFRRRGGGVFTDDVGKIWTGTGSAGTVSAPVQFGAGSLDLSASSGDQISTTSSLADFAFPGQLTVDFWFYWTGTAGVLFAGEGGSGALTAKVNANGSVTLSEFGVSDFLTTGAGDIPNGSWTFVSIARDSGNVIRVHTGGINRGGISRSTSFPTPSAFCIGAYDNGASENVTGYFDDFRVTKGVARYGVSNYTPPTVEAPVGGGDPNWANVVSLLRFN